MGACSRDTGSFVHNKFSEWFRRREGGKEKEIKEKVREGRKGKKGEREFMCGAGEGEYTQMC